MADDIAQHPAFVVTSAVARAIQYDVGGAVVVRRTQGAQWRVRLTDDELARLQDHAWFVVERIDGPHDEWGLRSVFFCLSRRGSQALLFSPHRVEHSGGAHA